MKNQQRKTDSEERLVDREIQLDLMRARGTISPLCHQVMQAAANIEYHLGVAQRNNPVEILPNLSLATRTYALLDQDLAASVSKESPESYGRVLNVLGRAITQAYQTLLGIPGPMFRGAAS